MTFAQIQADIRQRLTANTAFQNLDVIIEEDPEATAEMEVEADKLFETALLRPGLVLVVLAPFTSKLGAARGGAIAVRVHVPIAIIENKAVNRSADGTGVPALSLVESAMGALLPDYEFNTTPFGRPEMANGLLCYFLVAERVHTVRAVSP